MSLTLSHTLLAVTTSAALAMEREAAEASRSNIEVSIDFDILTVDDLNDIARAATQVRDTRTARAVESIVRSRACNFSKPVPNFKAFQASLQAFLRNDLVDGWVYCKHHDGFLYPELVTHITFDDGTRLRGKGSPSVLLHTVCHGFSRNDGKPLSFNTRAHCFQPQDVAGRRIGDILAAQGIFHENPSLKTAHQASNARHDGMTRNAFSEQFRASGRAHAYEENDFRREGAELVDRRVVHDLQAGEVGALRPRVESEFLAGQPDHSGMGEVPTHPLVRVFDLKANEYYWVNGENLTPHQYDESLRDKLILPSSHRDLLDVLTTDLSAFTADMIEGKSAGNVILCKGIPGVGKTLTAEVYAELIRRPLYAVHSGRLGTEARKVEENLSEVFELAKRWNCVLLLDEADVFVRARGDSIEQNAIVAEFLRALEYFDGLLFMTTNRPGDIDDAIVSRCAAVIEYGPPSQQDAAAIWRVMAGQYGTNLNDTLIGELVELFPQIAPRDIKMLLRLSLRVAQSRAC